MPWPPPPISVIYTLALIEIVTGLVMYNWLAHNPVLTLLLGWIPRMVNIQNLRLIHFCLMFVFIAFGILHVHLCMIVSSRGKARIAWTAFSPATKSSR